MAPYILLLLILAGTICIFCLFLMIAIEHDYKPEQRLFTIMITILSGFIVINVLNLPTKEIQKKKIVTYVETNGKLIPTDTTYIYK